MATTQRYAALLRGVSPLNAKMPALRDCFLGAGFTNVKTVLSSGNVVFDTTRISETALAHRIEEAMQEALGRTFLTVLRPIAVLERILESNPYAAVRLPPGYKRIVTFLRDDPTARLKLPITVDGARILRLRGRELYSASLPGPRGSAAMRLVEKTFGQVLTTRTWETVERVAHA